MPKFVVTVEVVRQAQIVIEAEDSLDARSRIGNLEFDPDSATDLVGWRITGIRAQRTQEPAQESMESALSLARDKMKF